MSQPRVIVRPFLDHCPVGLLGGLLHREVRPVRGRSDTPIDIVGADVHVSIRVEPCREDTRPLVLGMIAESDVLAEVMISCGLCGELLVPRDNSEIGGPSGRVSEDLFEFLVALDGREANVSVISPPPLIAPALGVVDDIAPAQFSLSHGHHHRRRTVPFSGLGRTVTVTPEDYKGTAARSPASSQGGSVG